MKICRFILVLISLTILAWSEDGFFTLPAKDSGAGLPADKVYPLGRVLPILGYAPRKLEQMKESGFTVAGPRYSKGDDAWIKEYPDYPVVYSIVGAVNGVPCTKEVFNKRTPLDFNAIREDVAAKVRKAIAQYPYIAFFYVSPEERRWWRANEFEYVRCLFEAIHANDPAGRPVFMYMPGHYESKSVAKYADRLDVLGKGVYVNHHGFKKNRVWVRYSVEGLKQAAAGAQRPKVILPVLEMMAAPGAEELPLVSAWARHDAYLSMLCGAHGFAIFSLHNRPALRKAYSSYYDAYKQVALELTSEKHGFLGEIFLFGERRDDVRLEVIQGPAELNLPLRASAKADDAAPSVKYPSVAHLSIAHLRGRFLFLVNSAAERVECRVSGLPEVRVLVRSAVSGEKICEAKGNLMLQFEPLEVKLYKLEKAE